MQLGRRVRKCDKFGADVKLNFAGEKYTGTVGGGVTSMYLLTITIAFFVMRIVAVAQY